MRQVARPLTDARLPAETENADSSPASGLAMGPSHLTYRLGMREIGRNTQVCRSMLPTLEGWLGCINRVDSCLLGMMAQLGRRLPWMIWIYAAIWDRLGYPWIDGSGACG